MVLPSCDRTIHHPRACFLIYNDSLVSNSHQVCMTSCPARETKHQIHSTIYYYLSKAWFIRDARLKVDAAVRSGWGGRSSSNVLDCSSLPVNCCPTARCRPVDSCQHGRPRLKRRTTTGKVDGKGQQVKRPSSFQTVISDGQTTRRVPPGHRWTAPSRR